MDIDVCEDIFVLFIYSSSHSRYKGGSVVQLFPC